MIMDSSARKITSTFRFKSSDLNSLKVLCSRILSLKDNKFKAIFGNIVDLLTEKVDYGVITKLAQYYYVILGCFTFLDIQKISDLGRPWEILNRLIKEYNPFPELEEGFCLTELSIVLGINTNKLVANWGTKGSVKGLTQRFLKGHAWDMIK